MAMLWCRSGRTRLGDACYASGLCVMRLRRRVLVRVGLSCDAPGRRITLAATAELAPFVMNKLKETLKRHGMELRSDKCTAYCPTPAMTDEIREEMGQFVKWTPEGFMILAAASDSEYRTEITAAGKKDHEPTRGRLQNARASADKTRQMCEG